MKNEIPRVSIEIFVERNFRPHFRLIKIEIFPFRIKKIVFLRKNNIVNVWPKILTNFRECRENFE